MTNPRKFSFQLQFCNEAETCRDSLVAEVVRIIKSSGGSVMGTSVGQQDGEFFANISAETQDSYAFWRAAKNQFTASPPPPKFTTMMIVGRFRSCGG